MVDRTAQIELDGKYLDQPSKNGATELNIRNLLSTLGANESNSTLTGNLVIKDFPNVTKIDLGAHKLTGVEIINCPNLKEIDFFDNQLNKLDFDKAKVNASGEAIDADKLTDIQCSEN